MKRYEQLHCAGPRAAAARCAAALVLAASALSVSAQSRDISSSFQGATITNNWGVVDKAWNAANADASNGTVTMTRSFNMSGPGGRMVPATAKTVMTRAATAGAVARIIGGYVVPGAVIGGAMVLIDRFASDTRTRCDGQGNCGHDAGQPPSDMNGYKCTLGGAYDPVGTGMSPSAACGKMVELMNKAGTIKHENGCTDYVSYKVEPRSGSVSVFLLMRRSYGVCPGQPTPPIPNYAYSTDVSAVGTVVKECPAVVDFHDPRYSVPGGPVAFDQKCPTGRYSPIDMAERAKLYEEALTRTAPDLAPLWDEILGRGNPLVDPAFQLDERTSSSSVELQTNVIPGPWTTTTNADGSTTTNSQAWNINPSSTDKRNFTVTPTTTTTTRDKNGNVISTTGSTTNGQTDVEASSDPCKADPGRLGCIGLGATPSEATPKVTRSVAFSNESYSLPASCPTGYALPNGATLSFDQACMAAEQIRPFVIVGGMLAAMFIVFAAVRS